jgi:hypothetical protein
VDDRGYLVGFVNIAHLLASTLPKFVTLMHNLPHSPEGADGWVRYNRSAMDWPVEELMDRETPAVDIEHSKIVAAHNSKLMGSVSNSVVRHAHYPVLIVRE